MIDAMPVSTELRPARTAARKGEKSCLRVRRSARQPSLSPSGAVPPPRASGDARDNYPTEAD